MLVAILAEDDVFARSVAQRLRLLRHIAIRYRDPVKLLDNLPELGPDALVVRERDYPVHWKVLAAALPRLAPARSARLILAGTPAFPPSAALGVTLIDDNFSASSTHAERESASRALVDGLKSARPNISI